jgi:hypothetical protein
VEKIEDEGKLAEMRMQQQILAKAELRLAIFVNYKFI